MSPQTVQEADPPKRRIPGEVGVWLLILVDMSVFALLFIVYLHYRNMDPALFNESQALLNGTIGFANTILLLTSSFCVARCVHIARGAPGPNRGVGWLIGACACGIAFVVSKVFEYADKADHGIALDTNDFFMFYYVLTGLHLLHVLIGLGLLGILWMKARKGFTTVGDVMFLEGSTVYWHMVDLLWIVIFPLLYLIG